MPTNAQDKAVFKVILILAIGMFITGLILVILGYYFTGKDMVVNSKTISGPISTLVVVGVIQMVMPIPLVFVGPALAKRISGK